VFLLVGLLLICASLASVLPTHGRRRRGAAAEGQA
jgi:hypothetical protein